MARWLTAAALVILLASAGWGWRSYPPGGGQLNIGAADDAGGLIVYQMTGGNVQPGQVPGNGFTVFTTRDCCATPTQWALGAGRLDLALLCPGAANELLGSDERYEVIGVLAFNTEVIVVRPDAADPRIGVTHNRPYHEKLVGERIGGAAEPVPMLAAALPFAYQRGEVDGVVVDFAQATYLDGIRLTPFGDIPSCILVGRRSLRGDPRLEAAILALSRSARELNDPETLRRVLKESRDIEVSLEEVKRWSQMGIRFQYVPAGA